jgi:hypothetical protein
LHSALRYHKKPLQKGIPVPLLSCGDWEAKLSPQLNNKKFKSQSPLAYKTAPDGIPVPLLRCCD